MRKEKDVIRWKEIHQEDTENSESCVKFLLLNHQCSLC